MAGPPPSYSALDWALTEARLRDAPLRLIHVADPVDPFAAGVGITAGQAAAEEITAGSEMYLRVADHSGDVVTDIVHGDAAGCLVDQSITAAMVVVGHRGRGGFGSLIVDSVVVQVTAHARCPVVVVRTVPPSERKAVSHPRPKGVWSWA